MTRPQWNWFVWGKHPGVPDFISAGPNTPLFQRFTKWVDTGFAKVDAHLRVKSRHCSWRFWTRGTSDEVVCGLVRNSCDSYGRSFPLITLGAGPMDAWARNCTLLPFAFEAVWKRFEYLTAARYDSIGRLNEALQLIEPPAPRWREYEQRIYSRPNLYQQAAVEAHSAGRNRLFKIDLQSPENLPHDLCFCSNVVAKGPHPVPAAVFIGEVGVRIAVAVIEEIVIPADFAWLWSLEA